MEKFLHPVELKNVSYERNKFKFQKKLKNFTFLLTLIIYPLLITMDCKAETLSKGNSLTQITIDDHWVLLKDTLGVKVYYEIAKCVSPLLPTQGVIMVEPNQQAFKLKMVNSNRKSKTIKISIITKTDSSDEYKSVVINQGTTILDCNEAPKLILTKKQGDFYPVSVLEFINSFKISFN